MSCLDYDKILMYDIDKQCYCSLKTQFVILNIILMKLKFASLL
jgi:hypothetical protein